MSTEQAIFGMGCFWGVERLFWRQAGVVETEVGYGGGTSPAPEYKAVCTGSTGHAELVRVVFDPAQVSYAQLLQLFWENHDPTQGNRQGNDIGSQYRSALYCTAEQLPQAEAARAAYQTALTAAGRGQITTEIILAPPFYPAEAYHQRYLAKNPEGYCGLKGTGVTCAL